MRRHLSRRARDLDRYDIALMNAVQENNLVTVENLSERIALSPTACQRRLKRLRENGAISADISLLSPSVIGCRVTLILLVALEREQSDLLDAFKIRMQDHPEIAQCYYVTGSADFILVINVLSMEEYAHFSERAFFADKNIKSIQTFAAMQTIKFTTKVHLS